MKWKKNLMTGDEVCAACKAPKYLKPNVPHAVSRLRPPANVNNLFDYADGVHLPGGIPCNQRVAYERAQRLNFVRVPYSGVWEQTLSRVGIHFAYDLVITFICPDPTLAMKEAAKKAGLPPYEMWVHPNAFNIVGITPPEELTPQQLDELTQILTHGFDAVSSTFWEAHVLEETRTLLRTPRA